METPSRESLSSQWAKEAAIDTVAAVIQTARNTNTPVIIERDGKIVELTADEAQKEWDELRAKQSS